MPEKWPRHYAAEIAAIGSLEGRREALGRVPEHMRELVKTHLKNTWEINRAKEKQKVAARQHARAA